MSLMAFNSTLLCKHSHFSFKFTKGLSALSWPPVLYLSLSLRLTLGLIDNYGVPVVKRWGQRGDEGALAPRPQFPNAPRAMSSSLS